MNIFDKTVELVNPEKALKRMEAREKMKLIKRTKIMNKGYGEHGASKKKNSMRGWLASLGGNKADIYQYRDILVARSRDL